MLRSLSILGTALLALIVASAAGAQTAPVQYGYDELGRLVVVVDQMGNTAIYNYDAVGNLLSIERADAEQLPTVAISSFTPKRGKAGTSVSIFGKGFSATPSQNTVSFNGGAAVVTSAAPNRLTVTVPSTAMMGPISVTTPSGAAVSADSFRLLGPLAVIPNGATLEAGASEQFTVAGPGGYTPPVDWAVDGIPGGNATVGTISPTGVYVAPASLPQSRAMSVSVADHDDPTTSSSVPVTVLTTGSVLLTAAAQVSARFPERVAIVDSVGTAVSAAVAPSPLRASVATVSAYVGGNPAATGTAVPVTSTFEPVITAISPTTIVRGESNVTVTLTGAGLAEATAVAALLGLDSDGNIMIDITSVSTDGTEASLIVTVASNAAVGERIMQVTTSTGTSPAVNTSGNVLSVQ